MALKGLKDLIPNFTAFRELPAISEWSEAGTKTYTYHDLERRIASWQTQFEKYNLSPGTCVAILSESNFDYPALIYAAWLSSLVVVPLDAKNTAHELVKIIQDCEPKLIVHSARFLELAKTVQSSFTSAFQLCPMDSIEVSSTVKRRKLERDSNELALIIYTSGTTGEPKGVMISFAALNFETKVLAKKMNVRVGDAYLSINPLNHLFELTCNLLCGLRMGVQICFCTSYYPQDIFPFIRERGVSRMTVVPLFLRLLKNEIERQIQRQPTWIQRAFHSIHEISKYIPDRRLRRLLHPLVKKVLGPEFREFVSGGASLDENILEFFEAMGLAVYQGYGMTETGPVISSNNRSHNRKGSVGYLLPGVEIKIQRKTREDVVGEIWVRGPNLMMGYYKKPELTSEIIDTEGWLHTGDLGRIDRDGFLIVSGRSKNLIVLAGGKKVQPEEVEELIARSPFVHEVCLIGERTPDGPFEGMVRLAVVVVPTSIVANKTNEELNDLLEDEIHTRLSQIASYKHPQRIIIRREELPKNTVRKVRRNLVDSHYQDQRGRP